MLATAAKFSTIEVQSEVGKGTRFKVTFPSSN